jgi:hypothetical protein
MFYACCKNITKNGAFLSPRSDQEGNREDVEHRSRTGRSWASRAGAFTTVSAAAAATAAAISLADTNFRRASRKPSTLFS